jgi:hypothetical protein
MATVAVTAARHCQRDKPSGLRSPPKDPKWDNETLRLRHEWAGAGLGSKDA